MSPAREAAPERPRDYLRDRRWHLVTDLKRDAAADGIDRAALLAMARALCKKDVRLAGLCWASPAGEEST